MTPSHNGDSVARPTYDVDDEALVLAQSSEPNDAEYALITDFLAGELSAEERKRVEERLRTDDKFRALAEPFIMIWNVQGPLDREADRADRIHAERLWERFEKRMALEEVGIHTPTLQEKHAKRRNRRRFVFGTIATMIIGWLAAWLRPQLIPVPSMYAHADAPVYQDVSSKLPDETEVTLTAGSHLSYRRWFSGSDERTLNLNGEATFTIAPGPRPALVVDGAGVEVKASAGRFSVHSYDGEPTAYVQVHEGSAEVRANTLYGKGEVLTLHAGEGVRVGPGLHIDRLNVIRPQTVRIK